MEKLKKDCQTLSLGLEPEKALERDDKYLSNLMGMMPAYGMDMQEHSTDNKRTQVLHTNQIRHDKDILSI